jgi:hypothetical protein
MVLGVRAWAGPKIQAWAGISAAAVLHLCVRVITWQQAFVASLYLYASAFGGFKRTDAVPTPRSSGSAPSPTPSATSEKSKLPRPVAALLATIRNYAIVMWKVSSSPRSSILILHFLDRAPTLKELVCPNPRRHA